MIHLGQNRVTKNMHTNTNAALTTITANAVVAIMGVVIVVAVINKKNLKHCIIDVANTYKRNKHIPNKPYEHLHFKNFAQNNHFR